MLLGLGLLLELLGLLLSLWLLLTHLLGLLLSLLPLLPLLGLLLATDELPSLRVSLWHLVWLLGLSILRRQLLGDLLWSQLRALLLALGRLLLWQSDLLVDLSFLLFAPLLVLLWLLDELSSLWVTRLQLGLDGFVLSELCTVTLVCGALIRTATLLCLLSLLALVLISLVTHGVRVWLMISGSVPTRLAVVVLTGSSGADGDYYSTCGTGV